jgi:hypothetical protein
LAILLSHELGHAIGRPQKHQSAAEERRAETYERVTRDALGLASSLLRRKAKP